MNLAKGQTGLSIAFDLPTQTGYDPDHILAHTVGLGEELHCRRLFITGATGFFGCWLT